jgi:hypothetical protein
MSSLPPPGTKRAFLMGFESLGANCEFGLVQRSFGAEPLGLLRWVGIDRLDQLIDALRARFAGLGEPSNIDHARPNGWPDFAAIDRRYGFYFHTDFQPDKVKPEHAGMMLERESARMCRLRDILLEDLEEARKIFVFRRKRPLSDDEAARLFGAVSSCGDATLLYVNEDRSRESGSVERIGPRLFKGYIDHLSNESPPAIRTEAWIRICEAAYTMATGSALTFEDLPDTVGRGSQFP